MSFASVLVKGENYEFQGKIYSPNLFVRIVKRDL